MPVNLNNIDLEKPPADMFDRIAEDCAIRLADTRGNVNKSTQLRKFYDELLMWEQQVQVDPEKFTQHLPLIRMMNAKVAYAQGRNLVDENFTKLMRHCISNVKSVETLSRFRLFFEAILGFHKAHKTD
jgi:CRISPR-associated protein Csm2